MGLASESEHIGYQVHIQKTEDESPSIHGVYEDVHAAHRIARKMVSEHPDWIVWVADNDGVVLRWKDSDVGFAEDCVSPFADEVDEELDLVLDPPYIDPICPHWWQMGGDGLIHCIHGCGVPPHEPNPDAVGD